jgi:enamine deaminase RidA (YjgF/YER057c/UK114 family)
MDFRIVEATGLPGTVNVSRFRGESGVEEFHIVVQPGGPGSAEAQLDELSRSYAQVLASLGLPASTAVTRRFFCSDVHNQAALLNACPIAQPLSPDEPCAVSWVGQPPAPPAKLALLAYHVRDSRSELEKVQSGCCTTLVRGALAHHWTTGLMCPGPAGSYDQTRAIFDAYESVLRERNLRLADHVIRTWLYVANIDADYPGLVVARREFFAARGLTPQTHFIASSGIQGAAAEVAAKVALDAYAISGVRPEQIRFLAAPEHLSPTHIYGVTFERGTSVAYRDRKHAFISGTASIDRDGNILHAGDGCRQLDRTLENMEALLAQAGATLADMSHFIVYVRDPADHETARRQMRDRFPDVPLVVVTAPVCRPGWLIEVEGMAVVGEANAELPAF